MTATLEPTPAAEPTAVDLVEERERLTANLPAMRRKADSARQQLQHLSHIHSPSARQAIEADDRAVIAALETAEARHAALPQLIHAARRREQSRARLEQSGAQPPAAEPPHLAALARQVAHALSQFADALDRANTGGT